MTDRVIVSVPPTCGIPNFEGKETEDPEVFLLKMKDYLVMHGKKVNHDADLEEIKKRISYSLQGKARSWFNDFLTANPDFKWDDFCKEFKNKFSVYGKSREGRLNKWRHLKWEEKHQTISEYAAYVERLGESLGFTKEDILEYFKFTIPDAIYVQVMALKTLDDCVQIIERWADRRQLTLENQLIHMRDEAGCFDRFGKDPDLEMSSFSSSHENRNDSLNQRLNQISDSIASLKESMDEKQTPGRFVQFKDPEASIGRYKDRSVSSKRHMDKSENDQDHQSFHNQSQNYNGYNGRRNSRRNNGSNNQYRGNPSEFKNAAIICYYCNKKGHTQNEYQSAKLERQSAQIERQSAQIDLLTEKTRKHYHHGGKKCPALRRFLPDYLYFIT